MPIGFKGFKSLGRRKSSTPAADSQEPPSPTGGSSTFRVIPRGGNAGNNKGLSALDKPLPTLDYRRTWSEEDNSSSNRASDSTSSTNNSRYDTYGEKLRMSDKGYQHYSKNDFDHHKSSPLGAPSSGYQGFLNMPTSNESDEDFGEMFSGSENHMKSGRSGISGPSPIRMNDQADAPARYSRYTRTPPPLHVRQNGEQNPSPYSIQSRNSNDGLLSSATPSPTREQPPPPPPHKSPPKKSHTFDVMRNVMPATISNASKTDSWGSSIIRRIDSTESFTRSGADGDNDARMVRNSVLARRDTNDPQLTGETPLRQSIEPQLLQPPAQLSVPSSSTTSSKAPSISSSASSIGQTFTSSSTPKSTPTMNQPIPPSNNTTPRANPRKYEDSDSDDEPLAHTLHRISSNPRLSMIAPPINGSRLSMAPDPKRRSTFDNLRSVSGTSASSKSVEDSLTSDTGFARASQDQNQDRLSGEISPRRPRMSVASQSAPLLTLPNHSRAISSTSRSSDDDDDVPLGLLPAANSPIRGRTPDPRFSQQSFMGQGRPGGGLGAPSTGGRPASSLPPFARRLPQDPYHSAASVVSASRESLMLRQAPLFPPGQSPVPGMPPGGLVGVIAEEERSKSWRRAGGQAQMGPMNAGMSMGMGGPTSIPGLGHGLMGSQIVPGMQAAEQSQFNQHLVQLVQQQSMMLQQMQAMMLQQNQGQSIIGYAEPDYGQYGPEFPGRPMSMMSQSRTKSMVNLGRPANAPRTMSMINPHPQFAPQWAMQSEPLISSATSVRGMANGYAASVAPSERSTIGQPNRYRPVTNPTDNQSTYGGYNRSSMANQSYLPDMGQDEDLIAKKKKSGFFQAMIHPRGSRIQDSQAEEEEDWSKFARKRRSAMPN